MLHFSVFDPADSVQRPIYQPGNTLTAETRQTRPTRDSTPPSPPVRIGGAELLVLGLFFLSGASALIYEVVWSRLLGFIFGGTAFAIATVLAAYMAGLALGSFYFGRRIDRSGHPLKLYALLEGGIALWAMILPFVLAGLNQVYGLLYRQMHPDAYTLSLIRFAFSFLALLVPTTLMGGTLPVLAKLLERSGGRIGVKTGLLYGINTVGAVVGTAVAGFWLIPALGMQISTGIAIAFNLAVTGLAFIIQRAMVRAQAAAPAVPETAGAGPLELHAASVKRGALLVYAISGFAAMAYQLAWTKVLSGVLGTTTYAFSAMLTTFLFGLSIGALLMARLADRHEPARLLAWTQLAIGFFGLLALPLFGNLPYVFIYFFKTWGPAWGPQTAAKFAICAATMLIPTLLMGGTFPLVARIYADDTRRMGRQVGELYAANTIGAIAGSFLAGFVLIPWLGRQGTILTAAALNVISGAGLYLLIRSALGGRARVAALATLALIVPVAVVGARAWDKDVVASGAYVYAELYSKQKDLYASIHDQTRLFYEEETEAIIAVYRAESVVSLRTNGKVEASSSGDMLTQKMISHLPLLYLDGPADLCMIGLASGISLGSTLAHPQVRRADCIEMLGGMREASSHFKRYNHDCLADPRAHLIINDGRNHLLLTDSSYDVIISQPSNPWIAGISTLFTREFFALGKKRLRPNGIFCQWVQMYQMSRDDFASVLKTFHEAFPHMAIWSGAPGDIILVGSERPLTLDYRRLAEAMAIPTVRADLADVGVVDVVGFLQNYVGAEGARDALRAPGARTITDDNLLLEFSMPRNLYAPSVPMMDVAQLGPARESSLSILDLAGLSPDSAAAVRARIGRYFEGRTLGIVGIVQAMGKNDQDATQILERAIPMAPTDPLLGYFLASSRNEIGIRLMQGGQEAQALKEFRRASEIGSSVERALALNNLGLHAFNQGQVDTALTYWERAIDLQPESPTVRYNLALLYENKGRLDQAVAQYREIVRLDPNQAQALNNLAWLLAQNPATAAEATGLAERSVRVDPSPTNLDTYGYALYRAGRAREAEKPLRRAVKGAGDNMETLLHLALVLADTNRGREARPLLERVARESTDPGLGERARERLGKLTP